MKTIILLRHSYAKQKSDTGDIGRVLTKRGIKLAKLMSCELKQRVKEVDLIVSSISVRTKETAAIFKQKVFPEVNIKENKALYRLYSADLFFDFVYELDSSYDTVLFVGHNPVFTSLAGYFTEQFAIYMHPASFVIASFDVRSWTDINLLVVKNVIYVNSKIIEEQNQ